MKLLSRPRVPLCHLLLAINVLTVCWGTEAATIVAPSASDGPKSEATGASRNETSPQEQETPEGQHLQQQQQQQQTSKHHRHRRENGGFTIGDVDGMVGTGGAGGGMVDAENFIALAPDEADIYNFPNMMSMTMANGERGGGGGSGMRDRNVNEANPFNEFHPSRRGNSSPPPVKPGGRGGGGGGGGGPQDEMDEQLPRPRTAGEKELPELTLDDDDDDDDDDGGDDPATDGEADGGPVERSGRRTERTEPRRRTASFQREANANDDQDGGNGGEVQEEDDDEEDDNAIERSRFLRRPVTGSNDDDGTTVASSRTESDAALLSKGLDLLNSLDGAYLLANARIGPVDRNKVAAEDVDDPDISTHKPIAPDTEQGGNGGAGNGGDGGNVGDDGNGAAGDDENAIFEQMEKKAKSYRLKLYKKHKNFKHTHHHRGGLYHQPYHTFHHDYYRRKMLERERERWKKMQDAKPDYQGQISYYENSNKLATNEDILAHLNGGHGGGGSGGSGSSSSQEKWPNFDRVMSSLKTEPKPDNVPPYIKKYNRRNKQLIDLLEGTIAPLSDYSVHKHRERKYHRRKNPHWMEEDLFEEQRPSQSKGSGMQRNYIQETIQSSTIHSNALPGEGIHIIYDKKHGVGDHDDLEDGSHLMYGRPTISSGHGHDGGVGGGVGGGGAGGHPNYKLSSRAGQFVYHRVASPQPLGGVGGYGRLKRQRLPFVAITDRRLSAPPKRRPAANNGGPNNPLLNHQPLP
ncbi:uncharacterized protein LOC125949127 isoform X2 [Anopheles darlingi]|uniref:uncharacterized protein LOC125949127 isoform X2 n=1 Tax=Anopheles darlingi TaxID=43151 RepID=UPI0020FFFADD|nr:uncharacterized protein LOC125949127 isoform X2 [Anopheles darlingi]